jgi:aryl-alcohol dehydrogenase-like predicted oxidoreductase
MKTVRLGTTDAQVSEMCLGTMMFGVRCDEREADAALGAAIDGGVNFIDTAAMYAEGVTEEILGRIMKGRRQKLFVTTKVHKGIDGSSIRSSIDESLARMKTDHVDLYMIHWPQPAMRPAEIMAALNDVVAAGKTRYIGFCNCPAWLFAHCNAIAAENGFPKLVCNQVPYNILERGIEVEVLPQAIAEGIAITTYRGLVLGLLSGKFGKGQPLPKDARGTRDARVADWLERFGGGIENLKQLAAERGVSPAHLAIGWIASQPGVTAPIIGVSSREQVVSAVKGFENKPAQEDIERLTSFFDTAVKEESGGRFPGMRRAIDLVTHSG